jgi:hypothetical protein
MNQKLFLGILISLIALTTFASALPIGPRSINRSDDSTWPQWEAMSQEALAGNVSQLVFAGTTTTKTYQGYYGNVTGLVVLGDSNNNTLYDWSLASPQGEIYAVRQVASSPIPLWESVVCASPTNIAAEDTRLNVNETIDEDSVNNTFVVGGAPDQAARFPTSDFTHPQFWVANQSITANSCAVATMYNSTYEPSPYFKEVLLEDSTQSYIIYTAIIAHTINPFPAANDFNGFNGGNWDFEMLVGEDGHGANTGSTGTTSTYWFYLELD